MDLPTTERASVLFGALAHPIRIQIVKTLAEKEQSVGEIANLLQIGQSNASQHLAILHRTGVLGVTQVGTTRIYRVKGPRIVRILQLIEEFCSIHGLQGMPADVTDV
jgi:ArsR family transcriptional regulator